MSQTRPTRESLLGHRKNANRFSGKSLTQDVEVVKKKLVDEVLAIFNEDIASNRAIGRYGEPLIPDGATVLTHCNAGASPPRRLQHGTRSYCGARDAVNAWRSLPMRPDLYRDFA